MTSAQVSTQLDCSIPGPTALDLARDPRWLAVCERMGYSLNEWQGYQPAPYDMEVHNRRMEELEAEQAARRAEYDRALSWVVSVARYNPAKVREALGLKDCTDQCDCECCYA